MNLLARLLAAFGFGGKSLDAILSSLTKLDKALEAYETDQSAKVGRLREEIDAAQKHADEAAALAERAARVRSKVGGLVA